MNDNCLKGIRCPIERCASEGPFRIAAAATFLVYDSGTDSFSDVEWDENSVIRCVECNHAGLVSDFEVPER